MDIVVFGIGIQYERIRKKLDHMHIIALLDNDTGKQGKEIDGIIVDSPDNICKYSFDYVFIMGRYWKEMRCQLIGLGIQEMKILDAGHYGLFGNSIKSVHYSAVYSSGKKGRVAVFTHTLALTGAPIVLRNLAVILKNEGYQVDFIASEDNELRYQLMEDEINIILYENFYFSIEQIQREFGQYDIFIVNTVILHELAARLLDLDKPVMWWLHEDEYYFKELKIDSKEWEKLHKAYIFGVSGTVIAAYGKYSGRKNIERLSYGIEKSIAGKKEKAHIKLTFAMIGTIDHRKGEDIFYKAVIQNWENWKHKAAFWLIGAGTQESNIKYEKEHRIKTFGEISHRRLMELMKEIDVIVCPSRSDPLPVVLAEGMMNKKICIASDATGTAAFIKSYENGLICKAGNVESLAEQIQWVLDNMDKLDEIGERAYELYEREFSSEHFRQEILDKIEIIIGSV